jgi:hypothetical protein
MKNHRSRRYGKMLRLCILLALWPAITVCETDSMLIVGFKRPSQVEPELERVFFPKNDVYQFPRELADRLRNSQSVRLLVDLGDTVTLDQDLLKGYGANKDACLKRLVTQMKGYRYYLVGRVGMDLQLARVSGELYEVDPNDHKAKLLHTFLSEHSLDERTGVARGSFVEDVSVSVEAKLDQLTRVLIHPFTCDAQDSLCLRLAPQVGELLRTRLAFSQNIRVLNASALSGFASQTLKGKPGETVETTIPLSGRKEAAHYVIRGSLFALGNVVSVEAHNVDVETGATILAGSVLLDSLSGKYFYDTINNLGDDLRRAIELQSALRKSIETRTLAVVALPPYPATAANKRLALEISGCVNRKLRLLQGSGVTLPSLALPHLLERYVEDPPEDVVMGRMFNTEYLCKVRLERPADQLSLSLSITNARSSSETNIVVGPKLIPVDSLDVGLNVAVQELVQKSKPDLFEGVNDTMIEAMGTIHIPHRPKHIAVWVAPSYLDNETNNDFAEQIGRNVVNKLKALEGEGFDVDVNFADKPSGKMDADYLWEITWFSAGNLRSLHMRLSRVDNPYGKVYPVEMPVDHLDHLAQVTDTLTEQLLARAFPEWQNVGRLRIEHMKAIQLIAPYKSIQGGLNLVGIIQDSRAVYGNHLRAGLEFKAMLISTDLFGIPAILGVAGEYDFGKTRVASKTRGRYASIVFRYYHSMWRESRVYGDVCPALINVEREAESVYGQVNFGIIIGGGLQMPLLKNVFIDLNGRLIIPFGETELGSAPPELFKAGKITSLSFGISVGWRYN